MRSAFAAGAITYADLYATLPFENTVDVFELRGDHLREALEFSLSKSNDDRPFSSYIMLQVSGRIRLIRKAQSKQNYIFSLTVVNICRSESGV